MNDRKPLNKNINFPKERTTRPITSSGYTGGMKEMKKIMKKYKNHQYDADYVFNDLNTGIDSKVPELEANCAFEN